MYTILDKKVLSPGVKQIVVSAPLIARKARPGEFVILRVDENGERIPLTIADFDRQAGTVTLIFQEVGATTRRLGRLETGDALSDLAGPLGKPTHIEKMGTVVCVGGGIGIAPIYPIARGMKEAGNRVISILGARTRELLILEQEMKAVSDLVYVTTDDGSYGRRGLVTDVLKELLDSGEPIAEVVAVGPVVMMRAVAETTRPYGVKTVVSLNPIMVDGTGMCGGCRVSVGGQTKFACVDGPEFDGHQVDFAGLMARQRMYAEREKYADNQTYQKEGGCRCRH
ncbi:sulfide/dihydroorotate dehydrogenase-like FAD/NAD-binding protein [Sporolituus thermophilus]|uniref:Sulfide dehydrogenase (Flavoprotein) subunit SudB n=1 Tax=Sporolituus thermophilus DSM 23256 TaxID=1123285 RepID=A0A1G7PQ19_9FIRM|nr:sulfide/dihydroorotate dehydrogenase-like FAD/NAD-binding protein [Sporolituus thermophilus]SDF87530.1 sulfide dehydrogenase (flavoprotein) subunit SudB [Sporolituus thermophilus DSM 23256]